ncbi:MAG: thioredoxin reductase, partial [Planctomycetota bacterium]
QKIGVDLMDDSQRPRLNEQTMETSVSGVFAAGTAVAGTQSSQYKIFLENCHEHVDKIVAHLTGKTVASSRRDFKAAMHAQPES